ncbi:catalase A [Parahypoxylon ruwenzoriense]
MRRKCSSGRLQRAGRDGGFRFTEPNGTFKFFKIHVHFPRGRGGWGRPSWDVYAQIIDPEVAEHYPINIFDATKTLL